MFPNNLYISSIISHLIHVFHHCSSPAECTSTPKSAHHLQAPPPHLLTSSRKQKMSSNPTDVSEWLVTPAPLNTERCGWRSVFSHENTVVERRDPESSFYGCVCYTSQPLPVGGVWTITVLATTTRWGGWGLVSECVLCLLYHLLMSVLVHYQQTQHNLSLGVQ